MVERYTLTSNAEEIGNKFQIDVTEVYQPLYNAAPTHLLPVITHEHPKGFSFFYWGLPPEMTKNKPVSDKLINAGVEVISSKTTYKNALLRRRCLIPSDGFYLWKKVSRKGRIPYRFILNDQQTFLIAGIWEEFDTDQSADTHTFSMITLPANDELNSYSNVMPAILNEQHIDKWMDHKTDEHQLINILYDNKGLEFGPYPVSTRINNIEINSPDLIDPTKPVDQFGNYSLFD